MGGCSRCRSSLGALKTKRCMASSIQINKIAVYTGHRDCVYTLERGATDNLFFSAAGDGMVVLWDLERPDSGELVARVENSVYAIRYLPDRHLLLIGHNMEGLQVIDLARKKILTSVALPKAAIFDLALSARSQSVFVGLGDGGLAVLDAETFALKKIVRLSGKSVRALALREEKQELAVGYSDHLIRVFDTHSLELKHELAGHTNSVFTVAYSPDGEHLLSGSRDAHLRIWAANDAYAEYGALVAHMYTINHLAYRPDGKYFATCSMDKSIKVWEAATFRLLKVIDRARHAGHGTSVNKLFWSGHRNQLVSCSDDRTISVWDINFQQEV
jgi:WD40 repeat protein